MASYLRYAVLLLSAMAAIFGLVLLVGPPRDAMLRDEMGYFDTPFMAAVLPIPQQQQAEEEEGQSVGEQPWLPPPPPGAELQVKLTSLVGKALNEFYAISASYFFTPCPDCVSVETKKLVDLISAKFADFCAAAEPQNKTSFDDFCSARSSSPRTAVLAALSAEGIDPLRLALTRCAAAGPCAAPPEKISFSSAPLHSALVRTVSPPLEREGVSEDGEGPPMCKECIHKTLNDSLAFIAKRHELICSEADAPPPVKAACKFAEDYPYLAETVGLLRLKPWEAAVCSCIFRRFCLPPPPPPPPFPPPHAPKNPKNPEGRGNPNPPEAAHMSLPAFPFASLPCGPPMLPPPIVCFLTLGLVCPPPPPPPFPPCGSLPPGFEHFHGGHGFKSAEHRFGRKERHGGK